jgi:hypothetical protein
LKLICHIGTPKTASTLIQNSFDANTGWLQDRGIAYGKVLAPDANHITLFFICAREMHDFARDYGLRSKEDVDAFRKRVSRRIIEHKASLPARVTTMVMSSENLIGNIRHVEEIQQLRAFLMPHFDDIKIVTYVRRQDDAILSMYGEFMRRGFNNETFNEFVSVCLGDDTPIPYLYYRRELSKWIDVWGRENMIVRRFSPVDFINGDILTDFMGVVQQTWEPDMEGFEPSTEDNRALSAPALEFLRRLHGDIPFIINGQPNPQRTLLTPFIGKLQQQPRPIMAAETARRIMSHFRPANKWLKEEFFPDLDGAFFPDRPDQPEHGNLGQLTLDDSIALTGRLLSILPIEKEDE